MSMKSETQQENMTVRTLSGTISHLERRFLVNRESANAEEMLDEEQSFLASSRTQSLEESFL